MDILIRNAYALLNVTARISRSNNKKSFVVEVVKCRDGIQEYAITIYHITTAPSSASSYAHCSNYPSQKTESLP